MINLHVSTNPEQLARNIIAEEEKAREIQLQKHSKRQQRQRSIESNNSLTSIEEDQEKEEEEEEKDIVLNSNKNIFSTSTFKTCQNLNTLTAVKLAIIKLQRKLCEPIKKKFYLHKCLRSHLLPLTNVAFDRSGERFLTGSYDRTCRVINTQTATVEHILEEHDNVVFAVAFNFPRW